MTRALALLAAVFLTAGIAGTAGAVTAPQPFRIENGVSQPIFSYANAIRETVWVDIGMDLDADGVTDRVAVDIIRPSEPAAQGQRIPVIMDQSPYFTCCGRGNENQKKTYAPDGTPTGFPLFYDNYFVPRGYAVALVDDPGTGRSTGCDIGTDEETAGVAVINWLNGRGAGYSSPFGSDLRSADWSNGSVGMIGKSNDALIAMGVAATGVPGLKTVIPIAGTSNNYYFWHPGGATVVDDLSATGGPGVDNPRAQQLCAGAEAADQQTNYIASGDFTPYWQKFDFNLTASRIRASVFDVQGFGDENVDPLQFGTWWQALTRYDVPRKAWLSQAGHVDPFDLRRADWVDTLHRWLDRWLLNVPNGIDHEPAISIEHTPNQWTDESRWPPAGTRPQVLRPTAGPTAGLGLLAAGPGSGAETITDSLDPNATRFEWATNPGTASGDRVVFTSAPLANAVRLAGTTSLTVSVRSSQPVARVGAELVDLGPATVRRTGGLDDSTGIVNLTTRSCWGASSATDSACYLDTTADLVPVDQQIIAVGWTDVGHFASPFHQVPLDPNRFYSRQLPLSTMDHIVPAGHRLALIIGGTDNFTFFLLHATTPNLTFNLTDTSVTIPVAPGGRLP
ncbi:MAG TPA: CocE/NonD family hydrolase [Pseudonocardiaceae bacterium]